MPYQHTVTAIFNPGEPTGFLYTVGMPRQELFALNVPRAFVHDVCSTMNVLSERRLFPDEGVKSGGLLFHLRELEGARRTALMKTHLCQMDSLAVVLELCPLNAWPEAVGPCVDLSCSCCMCAECSG